MLGYERLETENVPEGYRETKIDNDPFPITVWGENKPIPDNKLGQYLNETFYYYLNIYLNIKKFGLPYNWTDSPKWIPKLIHLFDKLTDRFEIYKLNFTK